MKNVTGIVTTSGNVNTDTAVKCEIDTDGLGHIMSILSNMYSNAPLAVLREYACNARDSHIASGQTRPIEVTLPSALQPSLLIQDYGLGLSKEDILTIYGTYGKSTKGDTNEQVGAFGIGSKSAFTMGQQFVVTGVKDGRKAVVLFALNEDNVGTMNVLHESDTDEPNGVLVSLAVEDVDRMSYTARDFFATWQPGTVLVNGVEPDSVYGKGFAVNEKVHAVPGESGVTVVMGAVGYPVSKEILRKVYSDLREAHSPAADIAGSLTGWSGQALFLEVEIGDVDIAPTRESLRDTPRTLRAIKALIESIATDLVKSVQEKVDAAATWKDAMVALQDARELLGGFQVSLRDVTWHGHALKDVEVELPSVHITKKSYRSSKMVVQTSRAKVKFTVTLDRLADTVVVTGVNEDEIGKVTRGAKRFLENEPYRYILVSPARTGTYDWFTFGGPDSHVKTITLEEYKEAVKSHRVAAPPKNEPSYDTAPGKASREADERTPLSEILEAEQDIVVFEGDTYGYSGTWMFDEVVKDRQLVVLLPTQSRDALVKRVAGQVEVLDGPAEVRKVAEAAVAAVTDEQREVLKAQQIRQRYQYTSWAEAKRFYADVMDDIVNDQFKAHIAAMDAAVEAHDAGREGLDRALAAASLLGKNIQAEAAADVEIKDVDDLFPLLVTSVNYWKREKEGIFRQHGVAYLNGLAIS